MNVEFLYRDAGNWKTYFDLDIDTKKYPQARRLLAEDEIQMGEYGTPKPNDFFNSAIHPYQYDSHTDHYTLEVVRVNPGRPVLSTKDMDLIHRAIQFIARGRADGAYDHIVCGPMAADRLMEGLQNILNRIRAAEEQ